jgi:hypothetical protein
MPDHYMCAFFFGKFLKKTCRILVGNVIGTAGIMVTNSAADDTTLKFSQFCFFVIVATFAYST